MLGAIILLLAAVFLLAAISKLQDRNAFRAVLLHLVPTPLVNPLSLIVPLVELLLAVFLVSGIDLRLSLVCVVSLLGIFTMVLVLMWRRGINGCACFGESVNTTTTGSGVIRNLLLIAAAVYVATQSGPVLLFGPDISTFLGRVTVVMGAICLWPCVVAVVNRRKIILNY